MTRSSYVMTDPLLASEVDGLPWNARKEQFSLGFVRLVAGPAGCWVKDHKTDFDGVDVTIASSAEYATFYCPEFEMQLKCTSRQDLLRSDALAWTMSDQRFDKLTNPKRYNPAYLGVLVVPEDPDRWIEQDEGQLLTKSRMYWARALDLVPASKVTSSRTVYLPRSNLFDVSQLLGIMKSIGEGGDR